MGKNKPPYFISFEGIEGVGKSENIRFVTNLLEQKQHRVLLTREPGGTNMAEEIRSVLLKKREEPVLPETEVLLLFAGRAQHIHTVIQPALRQGTWVLSDRFTESSIAYQSAGRGLTREKIRFLETLVLNQFKSDLVILLDAPVEIGLERIQIRQEKDRIEESTIEFFEKVRQSYLDLAQEDPTRFVVIDASQSLLHVQAQLKKAIENRFF